MAPTQQRPHRDQPLRFATLLEPHNSHKGATMEIKGLKAILIGGASGFAR
ncbi:MAG: hypothetical protein ACI8V4_003863, partial [Ilumatobacter sp.]